MKCDYCKENIQFNPNEEFVPINIIMINTLLYQFCSKNCYEEFIKGITYEANMDKAGHIFIKGGDE